MSFEMTKTLIQFPDLTSLQIKNCVINVGLRFYWIFFSFFDFGAKKKFNLERISTRGKERGKFK